MEGGKGKRRKRGRELRKMWSLVLKTKRKEKEIRKEKKKKKSSLNELLKKVIWEDNEK